VEAVTIECFNMEITQELSDMSELNHNNDTQISTESEGPEVLFTNAAESTCEKSTPVMQRDESPTIDSSSTTESTAEDSYLMGSTQNSSWHSTVFGLPLAS
jgi:hypothetical protein